jgi:hypothetical protein
VVLVVVACGGTASEPSRRSESEIPAATPTPTNGIEDRCASARPEVLDDLERRREALARVALERTYSTTNLSGLEVSLVGFALEVDAELVRPQLSTELALERGPLGQTVLLALGADSAEPGDLDRTLLELGLSRYYACSRDLPQTLVEFTQRWLDHRAFDAEVVETSLARGGPRTLYESEEHGIYVAESPTSAGVEIEVLLRDERRDGALDFLAFDAAGKRVDAVSFRGSGVEGALAVPAACVTCHRSIETARVNVVDPRSDR